MKTDSCNYEEIDIENTQNDTNEVNTNSFITEKILHTSDKQKKIKSSTKEKGNKMKEKIPVLDIKKCFQIDNSFQDQNNSKTKTPIVPTCSSNREERWQNIDLNKITKGNKDIIFQDLDFTDEG